MPYHCHSQCIARRRQPWLSSLEKPTFSHPCNNLPGFIPLFSSILPLNPFSYSNSWGKNNNNVSRNGQGTELGLICIILWCNVCNSCSNPNFSWRFFWCEDSCKGISDKKKKIFEQVLFAFLLRKSLTYQWISQPPLQWFFATYPHSRGGRSVCCQHTAHRMPKFVFTSTYSPVHNTWITYALSFLFFSALA